MTKKDYELIEASIYDLFLGHDDWRRSARQVATQIANTLADKDPKFDRDKFLSGCGIQD